MTLKERYEEVNIELEQEEEFKTVLRIAQELLRTQDSLYIGFDKNSNIVLKNKYTLATVRILSLKIYFAFYSEEKKREYANNLMYYIYMNTNGIYIETEAIEEGSICYLFKT